MHVDRITEDPAALCRLLDLAACELNGDMSHYLARGLERGKHVEKIMRHVAHTHVRMARKHGDLSAAVIAPQDDWAECGETGPMHLVTDTLAQDSALVPLCRAMARYADASAQGITIKVEEPGDLDPWSER